MIVLESPFPRPSSSRKKERVHHFQAKYECRLGISDYLLQGQTFPQNMGTELGTFYGQHSETNGGDEPDTNSGICSNFISMLQEYFPCTGRQVRLQYECIRRSEGFDKMIGQLFQIIFVVLCILLLLYPVEQLVHQFILLGRDGPIWDIAAFVSILYFGVYIVERLLLLHIAVFAGAQSAMKFIFLGMDAISKDDIEVEVGNNAILILLMSSICFGMVMLIFPKILGDKLFHKNINTEETEQLNIATTSANDLNPTIQTTYDLNRALTLGETIWVILVISSKCLNYFLQFISTGAWILVQFHSIRTIATQTILATAERDNFLKRLVKKYDRCIRVVRLWIKIYFWVLYFYNQILESFPDNKDAVYLPGVPYGLGILSMALAYCYIKYFK